MFVYKYELHACNILSILKTVIECDEKPKTYQPKTKYDSRIRKSEIGVVSSTYYESVYLLEDDFVKAKDLLIKHYESEIDRKRSYLEQLQNKIKGMEKKLVDIKSLNTYLESEER